MSTPQREAKPKPLYLRDLAGGMNISTSRESIADNEAWWMEGLQPIGPGNLALVPQASSSSATSISGEVTDPTYCLGFQIGGISYRFIVFAASGNGWVGQINGTYSKIFAGSLTSGQTCAAQWNKQGILIVDPTGFWDWSVTTANVLTALSNTIQSVTITDPGSNFTTGPPTATLGGPGSGALMAVFLGIGTPQINAAGANYGVGDVLQLVFGFASTFGTVTVTTVNATGGVTGISVTTQGRYVNAPVGAIPTIGGSGNGAAFNVFANVAEIVVSNGGSGYTGASTITLSGGAPTRAATAVLNVSGSLPGTSIAVYAGRAWIANGRTVTFTDAGSYHQFIGSGSIFTINDSYLINSITALYAANNYLYIFGDTSIDVLSNVTVNAAGTADFSRVNVSPSVGCSRQQAIFAYYRSIAFANPNGFFMLSGATVESVSEGKLDLLIPEINQSNIAGFPVTVNNQLCAAWAVQVVNDTLVNGGISMDVALLYYRGRWFASRQKVSGTLLSMRCAVSVGSSITGFLAYAGISNSAGECRIFSPGTRPVVRLYTKLYDMGVPMVSKQVMRAGLGAFLSGGTSLGSDVAFSIDTELGIGAALTMPAAVSGYNQLYTATPTIPGNAKYIGFGMLYVSNDSNIARTEWMALEYQETTPWQ